MRMIFCFASACLGLWDANMIGGTNASNTFEMGQLKARKEKVKAGGLVADQKRSVEP